MRKTRIEVNARAGCRVCEQQQLTESGDAYVRSEDALGELWPHNSPRRERRACVRSAPALL